MDQSNSPKRCGYVAIVGRPNAGKSTLLNALVGQKIAAVSSKIQTTRNRILGIRPEGDCQLLFVDTPGLNDPERFGRLNFWLQKEATQGIADADLLVYCIDLTQGWRDEDDAQFKLVLERSKAPVWLLGTKSDLLNRDVRRARLDRFLLEAGAKVQIFGAQDRVVRISTASAKAATDVRALAKSLGQMMPEGPWLYDSESYTDRSSKFVAAEIIREQAFRYLADEIPYGLTTVVKSLKEDEAIVRIEADLVVGKKSHKAIVIGHGGEQIKMIGTNARKYLEQLFGRKVHLALNVEVENDWAKHDRQIKEFVGLELGT